VVLSLKFVETLGSETQLEDTGSRGYVSEGYIWSSSPFLNIYLLTAIGEEAYLPFSSATTMFCPEQWSQGLWSEISEAVNKNNLSSFK
jgi:hypothetical protein